MPDFRACAAQLNRDRHVVGYASGNFGKAIFLGSIDITLLFLLTDIIGMPAAQVSLLMLVVFLGDLAFDIGAGMLAAHADRRGIGYPRLIALCVLPCACAFAALYALPLLQAKSFVLIATLLLLLRASYALIDVPHNALLARVTVDSHARGRASGYRTLFSASASVVVATVIAPSMNAAAGHATPLRMAWLGIGAGVLFCATLLLAAWSSRAAGRPCGPVPRQAAASGWWPRSDRLFGAIAVVAVVTGFAIPMFGKTLLYLCTYVLHDAALAGRVLLTLALSGIAGATLWIALVRLHDKTTLLALSHGVAATGIGLFACAGAHQPLLLACAALAGVGLAGVAMLPWGILADIVDFSEFRYRERSETVVFAAILVLLKAGGVAALATIGWTLGYLGYVPGAVQAPAVVLGLKALAFGVPVLGSLVAILVLLRLDIGHAMHARVRRVNGWRARARQCDRLRTAGAGVAHQVSITAAG
ncbi:MFS transporter [Massilia sp. HP4]|uniref:MFS transporter n=1 Tax=Massilia sp. HP4 TaxID=2562316 RepID=UPI0014853CD7|nr:MFS transporter [Massilia sp. HP4]